MTSAAGPRSDRIAGDRTAGLTATDLGRAVQRNLVESWLLLATIDPDTDAFDEDGVCGFVSGADSPLLNAVLQTRVPPAVADLTIERTLRRFADRGLSMTWWTQPFDEPGDLGERLEAHGLVDGGTLPGMALDLSSIDFGTTIAGAVEATMDAAEPGALRLPGPLPGLSIERVRGLDDLDAFLEIAVAALEAPEAFAPVYRRAVAAEGFTDTGPIRNYLGRFDGQPVATATLVTGGGVAGIFNVATEPAHRRHGFGSAMTIAALEDGRRLGLRVAALQATDSGHGIYAALGFQDVCTIGLRVLHSSP